MKHPSIDHPAHPHPPPALTRDWARIGLWLVAATMAYNVAEGAIALWAGVPAGSIALVGFGLDSYIECAAAAALLWRLTIEARGAHPDAVERGDQGVHRFVGATFLALALYVLGQAGWTLWAQNAPEESLVGIILAAASLVIMPLVSWGKLHAAKVINSTALQSEAKETLACSYLSFTLLLGLVANAAVGWWWADPLAALLMVPWLVKEGMEGLWGEHCCAEP
jgi:divalent metal cation (Fe/Co/Zn/Cd) transporter